jgi:hypothetical protein
MAVKTFYLVDGVDANGWQALSESTQAAADSVTGWVVGTGSTNSSELEPGQIRASSTFVGNTVPDGTLDLTLKDAFRIPAALFGTFPAGNWTFQFAVRSLIQAGAADGQIVFRLIKADADGSNATEITAAQQSASVVTNVGSAADSNSSLTLNPGAIVLNDQYLFIQIAWKRTGAGGMTTTNIRLRTGSAATPTGTVIVSTNFAPTLTIAIPDEGIVLADGPVLPFMTGPLSAGPAESLKISDTVIASLGLSALLDARTSLASDDFNRADDPAGLGANWTQSMNGEPFTSPLFISANKAISSFLCFASAFWTARVWTPDQWASCDINLDSGPAVRTSGITQATNNQYFTLTTGFGATLEIRKVVNGAATIIATASAGAVAEDTLRLEVRGSELRAYHKGAVKLIATDTTHTTGSPGAISISAATVDNWQAGQVVDGEGVRVTDTVIAQLVEAGGGGDLTVSLQEDLKLADAPVAARTNPDQIVLAESLRLADTLSVARDLTASLQEDLKLADGPAAARTNPDAVVLGEALGISDSLSVSRDLTASLQEDLTLSDGPVLAIRDLTVSLQEDLRISDGPATPTLFDLNTAPGPESLKIADTLSVTRDIEATGQERLTISDGPVLAVLTPLEASPAESLKIADTLTVTRTEAGVLAVSLQESLKLADTISALRLPLEAALQETLRLTDTLSASRDLTASLTEAVRVADTLSVARDLTASLAEAVRLADTLAAALDLTVSLQESLRISDTLTAEIPAVNLAASLQEDLKLADTLTAARDLVASLQEDLKLADAVAADIPVTDLSVSLQETLKLADILAVTFGLGVLITETLKLSESASTLLNPLLTSQQETLKLADTLSVTRDLTASLAESLRLAETVVTARDLTASAQENLRLTDTLAATRDLIAELEEGLRLADTLTPSITPLEALLAESLRLRDLLTVGALGGLDVDQTEALRIIDSILATLIVQLVGGDAVLLTDTAAVSLVPVNDAICLSHTAADRIGAS